MRFACSRKSSFCAIKEIIFFPNGSQFNLNAMTENIFWLRSCAVEIKLNKSVLHVKGASIKDVP